MKLHETASALERGIGDNLYLCSQAMVRINYLLFPWRWELRFLHWNISPRKFAAVFIGVMARLFSFMMAKIWVRARCQHGGGVPFPPSSLVQGLWVFGETIPRNSMATFHNFLFATEISAFILWEPKLHFMFKLLCPKKSRKEKCLWSASLVLKTGWFLKCWKLLLRGDNESRVFTPLNTRVWPVSSQCAWSHVGGRVTGRKYVRMYACVWLDLVENAMDYRFSFLSPCKTWFGAISRERGYGPGQNLSIRPVFN